MATTVFFSWQADTETRGGRNFIETALKRAASRISKNTEVEGAVRELAVDRDTVGVAGSPPIVDTIFRKIDQAAVFVPDLTFIGERLDGRPTPNSNVLVEYGWALKSIGHGRIVPIMNTAYGEPIADAMPFNMRHLRNPIAYQCTADLDDDTRKQVREKLAKELEFAIREVLDSEEFRRTLPEPPQPQKYVERKPADGRGRFKRVDQPVGIVAGSGFRGNVEEIRVSGHPASWFRMMPLFDPGSTWTVGELATLMQTPTFVHPLTQEWSSFGSMRSIEGFGNFAAFTDRRDSSRAIVFAFTTGELWSIDTYWLEAYKDNQGRPTVPTDEKSFRNALLEYGKMLERMGVKPPYRWIAGMESLKGRVLYLPPRPGHMRFPGPHGKCLEDVVSASGIYSPGDPAGPALKPFFESLYNACGVSRESWQDA
jgi:hypothetical protein